MQLITLKVLLRSQYQQVFLHKVMDQSFGFSFKWKKTHVPLTQACIHVELSPGKMFNRFGNFLQVNDIEHISGCFLVIDFNSLNLIVILL